MAAHAAALVLAAACLSACAPLASANQGCGDACPVEYCAVGTSGPCLRNYPPPAVFSDENSDFSGMLWMRGTCHPRDPATGECDAEKYEVDCSTGFTCDVCNPCSGSTVGTCARSDGTNRCSGEGGNIESFLSQDANCESGQCSCSPGCVADNTCCWDYHDSCVLGEPVCKPPTTTTSSSTSPSTITSTSSSTSSSSYTSTTTTTTTSSSSSTSTTAVKNPPPATTPNPAAAVDGPAATTGPIAEPAAALVLSATEATGTPSSSGLTPALIAAGAAMVVVIGGVAYFKHGDVGSYLMKRLPSGPSPARGIDAAGPAQMMNLL